jgi:hypothetical protein
MTDPLTIDDVIRNFGDAGHVLPRASMQWALDNWVLAAPRFIELLSRYADGTDRREQTENALVIAVHLLGEKAETAAFASLCRLLRDQSGAEQVFGDAVTTTLPRVLISTYDGAFATLASLIEDAGADEFVRDAAMQAMAYLTRTGRIPKGETHAYLRHLLTAMQPQSECYVWVGWTECVAALGFADFTPDVRRLFDRGLVDPGVMEYSDFEADLKLTLDDPERMAGLVARGLAPFTGAIDELAGWYGFSEQRVIDEARRAKAEEDALAEEIRPYGGGVRNPLRDVGRNDPCPCGSGKKFKKCCLGKAAADISAGAGMTT